ncbi:fibronectin type III domain-containing protein [Virgibacillus oceani]|uniref:Fibronectin type-III domain-containing protein n=1 Tax=Virgibacillus oceani TaxID=1479511 RepID=A0A917LXS9_9BACI|nr:fibronectin type III domain-containing protein [Virgibacillus oceani]GGG64778.1 hypothetical protein GCM10011398_05500 [Virgibacillus oceani]
MKQFQLPNEPADLTASNETATTVDLNWTAVEGASGYNVYQDGVKIDTVTTNSYSVTGLTTATTYDFYVTATNDTGESEPSNTVNVTTL